MIEINPPPKSHLKIVAMSSAGLAILAEPPPRNPSKTPTLQGVVRRTNSSARNVEMDLGCVKTLAGGGEASRRLGGAEGALCRGWLGSHRGHERLNAHDVHDTGKIVGRHVQRHL